MKGWEPWSCCGRVQIQVAFYNNPNVYCAVTSMPSCDLSDRDRDSLSLHVSFKWMSTLRDRLCPRCLFHSKRTSAIGCIESRASEVHALCRGGPGSKCTKTNRYHERATIRSLSSTAIRSSYSRLHCRLHPSKTDSPPPTQNPDLALFAEYEEQQHT